MNTQITTATNAIEAKILVDAYLSIITGKQALEMVKISDSIIMIGWNESNEIGAGSYYYGAECKMFCNEKIRYEICNMACDYAATIKDAA